MYIRLYEEAQALKQHLHFTTLLENAGNNVDQGVGQDVVPPAADVVPPAAKFVSTSHDFEWHAWETSSQGLGQHVNWIHWGRLPLQ